MTRTIRFSNALAGDLSFAENVLCGCFHAVEVGRTLRSPLGLFRAFIVMRMKGARSLRESTRLLDVDVRLRKLYLKKVRKAIQGLF